MTTSREETGVVTDSMLARLPGLEAENVALKAENTSIQTALLKAQDRITQLEKQVADLKAAARKRSPAPPPK